MKSVNIHRHDGHPLTAELLLFKLCNGKMAGMRLSLCYRAIKLLQKVQIMPM